MATGWKNSARQSKVAPNAKKTKPKPLAPAPCRSPAGRQQQKAYRRQLLDDPATKKHRTCHERTPPAQPGRTSTSAQQFSDGAGLGPGEDKDERVRLLKETSADLRSENDQLCTTPATCEFRAAPPTSGFHHPRGEVKREWC